MVSTQTDPCFYASVRAHSHEQLSALDQETREELHAELEKVHQKMRICTILVSHDLREIFRLSDKVLKDPAASCEESFHP